MADKKLNYSFMIGYRSLHAQPWTAKSPMYRGDNLYGYACHEGNYKIRAILAGARTLEKGPSAPSQSWLLHAHRNFRIKSGEVQWSELREL